VSTTKLPRPHVQTSADISDGSSCLNCLPHRLAVGARQSRQATLAFPLTRLTFLFTITHMRDPASTRTTSARDLPPARSPSRLRSLCAQLHSLSPIAQTYFQLVAAFWRRQAIFCFCASCRVTRISCNDTRPTLCGIRHANAIFVVLDHMGIVLDWWDKIPINITPLQNITALERT
jgi:hypothetical protein